MVKTAVLPGILFQVLLREYLREIKCFWGFLQKFKITKCVSYFVTGSGWILHGHLDQLYSTLPYQQLLFSL